MKLYNVRYLKTTILLGSTVTVVVTTTYQSCEFWILNPKGWPPPGHHNIQAAVAPDFFCEKLDGY